MLLISVHLPKTAGSSFLAALQAHFGDRLRHEVDERPLDRSTPRQRARAVVDGVRSAARPETEAGCIHGHLMPLSYRGLARRSDVDVVTWVREPVDRLLSHYHYWAKDPPPAGARATRQTMHREAWSIERFCLGPEMRNVYSRYLWGFPLEQLAFVGLTEHYATDLAVFGRSILGRDLPVVAENVNRDRADRGEDVDPALRARIEAHHANDVALYRAAGLMRLRREH